MIYIYIYIYIYIFIPPRNYNCSFLHEEFQTRLSQVRFEVSSCGADGKEEQSSVDPTQDESIRKGVGLRLLEEKRKELPEPTCLWGWPTCFKI